MKNHVKFVNEEYPMYGGSKMHERMCLSSFCKVLMIAAVAFLIAFICATFFALNVNAADYEREVRDMQDVTIKWDEGDLDESGNPAFEWTGEQIKPWVTIWDTKEGTSLRKGYDYTVTYGDNVEPGKGTITVTGMGEAGKDWRYVWNGSKTFEFTINKTDLLNACNLENINSSLKISFHDKNDGGSFIRNLFNSDERIFIKNIKNKKYRSSNKNIFTVGKRNTINLKGIGVAYLYVNVPETEHTLPKQFKFKVTVIPDLAFNGIKSKNGKLYVYFDDNRMSKSKTNFKYKVEIYKNKSCSKKGLVKAKTVNGKMYAKGKTLKIKGLRKGKIYWVKIYSYKKINSKITLKTGTIKEKIKIK